MKIPKNRFEFLSQIRNPLIFFALALLLIEAIIGTVVATSNLKEGYTFASICIMAGLFLTVVVVVSLITIKWPTHLYREVKDNLEITRQMAQYLQSRSFKDTIEDVIYEVVDESVLKKKMKTEDQK